MEEKLDAQFDAGKFRQVRELFPILREKVNGHPFIYLDSAASAQKPDCVLKAMDVAARRYYANIHRGLYQMSERTSEAYEGVRRVVADFINAGSHDEIVYTRNATEGMNLLAHSLGASLKAGDVVALSELEHHANIVPWLMLRERKGIEIKVAPITDAGDIDPDAYKAILDAGGVKIVSLTAMSNVLGTKTPIKELARMARERGAMTIFDLSQRIVHDVIDVRDMGIDFAVFTGHKLYGPTAIGILWGRYAELDALPPFLGGGDMIKNVSFKGATYAPPPHRFEAGTPPILEVIGLGEAIRFLKGIDPAWRHRQEALLTQYSLDGLADIEGVRILGRPKERGAVVSFVVDGVHPHDLSLLLNQKGVAIRAGQHCAEPLMKRLGIHAGARMSCGIYTSLEEIDAFGRHLRDAIRILRS